MNHWWLYTGSYVFLSLYDRTRVGRVYGNNDFPRIWTYTTRTISDVFQYISEICSLLRFIHWYFMYSTSLQHLLLVYTMVNAWHDIGVSENRSLFLSLRLSYSFVIKGSNHNICLYFITVFIPCTEVDTYIVWIHSWYCNNNRSLTPNQIKSSWHNRNFLTDYYTRGFCTQSVCS